MDETVPADGNTARKDAPYLAEVKTILSARQTPLSKHLQLRRAQKKLQKTTAAQS